MNDQITDTSTEDRRRAIAEEEKAAQAGFFYANTVAHVRKQQRAAKKAGDNPPVTLKEARQWVYRGTTTRSFANQFMGWMFSNAQDPVVQAEVMRFLASLSPVEREELRKKATP